MSNITLYAVLEKMRDVLKNNAALEAYCQATYNTEISVYVGADMSNPPGDSDCPFVMLIGGGKSEGQEVGTDSFRVNVFGALMNEDQETTGKVTEYTGVRQIDELMNLILSALEQTSVNVCMSVVDYEILDIEFFPMWLAAYDIRINVPNLIGGSVEL